MVTKDINALIKEGDSGVAKLYKAHEKHFALVDEWSNNLIEGDLLDEYEIASCMERLTGCLMGLGTVAGALEALLAEMEHGAEVREYRKIEKIRTQDCSVVRATARDEVSKIRKWASDFRNYFNSAQSGVITAQSRLKRLTVEKSAKRVDYCGETKPEESSWD